MKMKKIVAVLIVIIIVLEGVNIYLANRVSYASFSARKISDAIQRVEEENEELRGEVLKYESLENIASAAAMLGFVSAREFVSLDSPLPLAARK
jgi:cell division protein FtsL